MKMPGCHVDVDVAAAMAAAAVFLDRRSARSQIVFVFQAAAPRPQSLRPCGPQASVNAMSPGSDVDLQWPSSPNLSFIVGGGAAENGGAGTGRRSHPPKNRLHKGRASHQQERQPAVGNPSCLWIGPSSAATV